MIGNWPIDRQCINDYLNIFSSSTFNIQGEFTCNIQSRVNLNNVSYISSIFPTCHQNIILEIDVVEIKGVRFLDTYSHIIKFSTAIELQGTEFLLWMLS